MKIYSFPRGGFPYDDPTAPLGNCVVDAYLPALSVMSMGGSAKRVYPVVSVGDTVKEGMLIGKASGNGAVNVHAAVPGKVIRKVSWKDRDGLNNDALVISMEGAFEKLGKKEETYQWTGISGYDIRRIMSEYGIVEMEGGGRSFSDIISSGKKINEKISLVIRCVFDDPWLAADYALCNDRLDAVIEGAAIAARAIFNVTQIVFAVSHHENELAHRFVSASYKLDIPSSIVMTGSRYPQKNSRELELALRIYEKKENMDLGSLLIFGPAVLAACYDAVVHKKPILDRYVAVGGSAVSHPQVMKVRIGTRIGELIEQCGGFSQWPQRIVMGSPLSGREIMYLDEPVGKTCYAIAAMSKSQATLYKQQNCINCGECRAVCPVGLDPQNIYKRIISLEDNTGASGCHGCGCCKIVCPSALPLFETILEGNREAAGA